MSKIIKIYLFFVIFLNIGLVRAQWLAEKCPTENDLNDISLIDRNTGWIVGEKGTILYKSGNDWKEYQKLTGKDLNSVFMINSKEGWAVGDEGTIIHYIAGYWNFFPSPTKHNLLSVSFRDSDNGICVGDLGTILIFKDGDWSMVENEVRASLYSVYYERNGAWIGGGLECVNVPLIKMEINENNLTYVFNPYPSVNSICLLNKNNGWAVGSPNTILHFDGTTWEKESISFDFASLISVFFSEDNSGISVGYAGTILVYNNGTWIKEKSVTIQNLKGSAISGNTFYAVGEGGTIITKKPTETDNYTYLSEKEPEEIKVFPNPCSDILNIIFQKSIGNEDTQVSIVDKSGQTIIQKQYKSLVSNLSYPLVISELKNGLYFLKAVSDSKTSTVKFVVKH
jgi:photosystem II stability/assembly factor-like uncharacterized protein